MCISTYTYTEFIKIYFKVLQTRDVAYSVFRVNICWECKAACMNSHRDGKKEQSAPVHTPRVAKMPSHNRRRFPTPFVMPIVFDTKAG